MQWRVHCKLFPLSFLLIKEIFQVTCLNQFLDNLNSQTINNFFSSCGDQAFKDCISFVALLTSSLFKHTKIHF